MLFEGIDYKDVRVQFETALLVHNAAELLHPLELRRAGRKVQEKTLICDIEPLQDLLDSLAVQTATLNVYDEMMLHP